MTSPTPYVTIDALAEHLSLAVVTVRKWLYSGKIPNDTYIKVGNTYRFNIPAVEHALLRSTQEQSFEESIDTPKPELPEVEEPEQVTRKPFILDDEEHS